MVPAALPQDHGRTANGLGQRRPQQRWPALDGLRGIAVLLVVFYHFHAPGPGLLHLRGGWAGVDVFFVLSGFLITGLLLREHDRTGRVSLGAFYRRRFWRLVPALLLLVLGWEVASTFLSWPGQTVVYTAGARARDLLMLSSMGLNWWWVAGAPVPPGFGALWSLAVEDQFYLLWAPVVALLCLVRARAQRTRLILMIAAGGAAISAVECFALYPTHHDQVRIYFATDTRAQGLLIGAVAAVLWEQHKVLPEHMSRVLAVAGAFAIALVGVFIDDASPWRVEGSFTLLALATLFVVRHVVNYEQSRFAHALSWRPLRWTGRRSYAIYLWHAPIATYMYSLPGSTSSSRFGWPAYFGGIALALVMAEVSWRLVERRCFDHAHAHAPRAGGTAQRQFPAPGGTVGGGLPRAPA